MGVHADNGKMMSKPYAAGGAYISKMSTYCKGCVYDPKLRVGDNACPFTTLYWDFLDRNHEQFVGNHRMAQQLFGIKRLKDGVHVIVGTPGRIHDMMKKGFFKTDYLRLFVMDEADEMLSRGFKQQI